MMRDLFRRFLFLVIFLLPVLVACSSRGGQLKPLDPDDAELLLVGQPQLVTFSQLQLDPDSFRNKLIRVSGTLLKAPPPDCVPYSGPDIEWALVAEELRLDASGFERAISMLDDGLPMTVDGFFRLYQGPLGCGKGAEDGSAWFLEVIKVVQPNPLVASGLPPGGILPPMATTPGAPILPPGSTPSPSIQLTPGTGTPQGTPGLTPTELATATSIPTATSTAGPGTPTVTTIPTASPTAPATSQVTPTPTPAPGTPTPTPTRGTGPTTTPTSTISGYPGPGTPTATATVGGYPPFPSTTLTPSYP